MKKSSRSKRISLDREIHNKNILKIGFIYLAISLALPMLISNFTPQISSSAVLSAVSKALFFLGLIILYVGFFKISKQTHIESQNYLKESRPAIFAILSLFILSIIIGFIASPLLEEIYNPVVGEMMSKVETIDGFEIIPYIFINNVGASFIGLFAGIIFLISLGVTISNGSIIGYVLAKVYEVSGTTQFWRLLPHGIFELPAILISLGLGINLGLFFISKTPSFELKKRFYNSLIIFLRIVVPLLVIAALIEGILIVLLT